MSILIDKNTDNVKNILTEEINTEGQKEKRLYIEGIFTIPDKLNQNERLYPNEVCAPAIEKYVKSKIIERRAYGEIMHPDYMSPHLGLACLLVQKYEYDPNQKVYMGKAKILSTPQGQIIQSIAKDGGAFGVSTRGDGYTQPIGGRSVKVTSWDIYAVDIVGDPSVSEAMMEMILENKLYDYGYDKRKLNELKEKQNKIYTNAYSKEEKIQMAARLFYEALMGAKTPK